MRMETRQNEDAADARRKVHEDCHVLRRDHLRTQSFRDHLAQRMEKERIAHGQDCKRHPGVGHRPCTKNAFVIKRIMNKTQRHSVIGQRRSEKGCEGLSEHVASQLANHSEESEVRLLQAQRARSRPAAEPILERLGKQISRSTKNSVGESLDKLSALPPKPDAFTDPRKRDRARLTNIVSGQDKEYQEVESHGMASMCPSSSLFNARTIGETQARPVLTTLSQLVRFATVGSTPCGALEVQLGFSGLVLGGLAITIRSLGDRKVAMIAHSNGTNQSLIRRKAKSLLESLSAESLEVLEFVVR